MSPPVRSAPGHGLFGLNSTGISPLADDLTGLWITTPTAQRSDLKWALNAPFSPDVGRQSLALNNPENLQIAEEIAQVWGETLIEFFDETNRNWGPCAKSLGLHSEASFDSLWKQVWNETTRILPMLDWEDIREEEHDLHQRR